MTQGLGNLRVLSLNVNGLQSSRAKRLALFQWLAELQVDIAVLLETHCRDDRQAERWVQDGAAQVSVELAARLLAALQFCQ
jgi:exonuclease III